MEDCFVAAQEGRLTLGRVQIDLLLGATDLLSRIAHTRKGTSASGWREQSDLDAWLASLAV
jgi:two-component system sensor histidine kinase and response regulator WspE